MATTYYGDDDDDTTTDYLDHEIDAGDWLTLSPDGTEIDNDSGGYPRAGGSQNRMPTVAESSTTTRTIIIATSVTFIALIVILITVAMTLRHRDKLRRAYRRAAPWDYQVEVAADTAFCLGDQDDPDVLPESATSTLTRLTIAEDQRSRSGSRSNQSQDTFIWDEM
jgi:hypothetical protein